MAKRIKIKCDLHSRQWGMIRKGTIFEAVKYKDAWLLEGYGTFVPLDDVEEIDNVEDEALG